MLQKQLIKSTKFLIGELNPFVPMEERKNSLKYFYIQNLETNEVRTVYWHQFSKLDIKPENIIAEDCYVYSDGSYRYSFRLSQN